MRQKEFSFPQAVLSGNVNKINLEIWGNLKNLRNSLSFPFMVIVAEKGGVLCQML